MLRKLFSNKKGQGLVEYGLIIAGVALVAAAAVSLFGHKTTDLFAAVATVLPGAHSEDNAPVVSGRLIETTDADAGAIGLNLNAIAAGTDTDRMQINLGINAASGEEFSDLIVGSIPATP